MFLTCLDFIGEEDIWPLAADASRARASHNERLEHETYCHDEDDNDDDSIEDEWDVRVALHYY